MAAKDHYDFDAMEEQIESALRPADGFSDRAVEHFRTFVREGGFQVDNRDVSADAFYWLDPLYDITRADILGVALRDGTVMQKPNPKYAEGIMMRKASQMGATVFSILFLVWLCIDRSRGLNVGCFWPNEDDVIDFVQMRFTPLVESSQKLKAYIRPSNINNSRSKQIGRSNLFFRYVNGKSQTDSVPMDVIVGDEVRLWGEPERVAHLMQRMEERFGQSTVRLKVWMSTVGSPGDAMESRWRDSNQVKYFTACPNGCVTEIRARPEDEHDRVVPADETHTLRAGAMVVPGVCLSDHHPHKITRLIEPRVAVWCCPHCQSEIEDTSVGEGFVETFPDSPGMYGLEFARTLSRNITPFKLRYEHDNAKDKKQFWNGWMAKSYRDPRGALVKEEHVRMARADSRVQWYLNKPPGMYTYLGADFRTEEIHWVVLGLTDADSDNPSGQVVSMGVIQGKGDDGEDPFQRLERLLFDFAVEAAIIDYRPFTTTTLAMAQRNSTRLYLASYVPGEMIRMKKPSTASKAASDDVRETNIVLIDQTKALKYSLNSFAMGNWKMSPEPFEQVNFKDRKQVLHAVFDVAQEFGDHLQNLALSHQPKVTKNASGEVVGASAAFEEKFVDVNYDPHFTHAYNYAVMASRLHPTGVKLLSGHRPAPGAASITNPLGLAAPAPVHATGKRCGTCRWWEGDDSGNNLGRCERMSYQCRAMDPVCPHRLYRPRK